MAKRQTNQATNAADNSAANVPSNVPSNVDSNSVDNQENQSMTTDTNVNSVDNSAANSDAQSPAEKEKAILEHLAELGLGSVGVSRFAGILSSLKTNKTPLPSKDNLPTIFKHYGAYLTIDGLRDHFGAAVSEDAKKEFLGTIANPIFFDVLPTKLPKLFKKFGWGFQIVTLTAGEGDAAELVAIEIKPASGTVKEQSDAEYLGSIHFPKTAFDLLANSPEALAELRAWYTDNHPVKAGETPVSIYLIPSGDGSKMLQFFAPQNELELWYTLSRIGVDGWQSYYSATDAVRARLNVDLNATNAK